jgi:chemotaxis protein methyltransferase CheR
MGPRPLTEGEFEQIRRLAHEKFGLDLKPGKQALVAARLGKKLRNSEFRTFQDYYRYVERDSTGEALIAMIDALTTNYTSFGREPAHFEFLTSTVWPALRRSGRTNIWSAACSTGEEPYSIIMALMETPQPPLPASLRVLATDISTRVLETARLAIYSADRVRVLPQQQVRKYFLKGEGRWEGSFRVKPHFRSLVEFSRFNLIHDPPPRERFDVIFCRNVMIYFDKETQARVVNRLTASLEPGGYLFIGHSESLTGLDHCLTYVCPAVYRLDAGRGSRWQPSS